MNEHYNYNCYIFHLKSNIPLSFLRQIDANTTISDYVIDLACFDDTLYKNDKIYFLKNKNEYIIESPFSSYAIDVKSNKIKAYYENKVQLESTLYNLPFSIVAQNHNDILLHASSIEYGKKIIAFCADKGIGKTTFVSHLSKAVNFFSDDTLYLTKCNNAVSCFSNGIPLKMNFDTFRSLSNEKNVYEESNQSLQNKKYIESEKLNLKYAKTSEFFNLKSIFFLRRVKKKQGIKIININNEMQKKSLLVNNVVGISCFLPEHVKRIINSPLFLYIIQNISFKYLDIRDDLSGIQGFSETFYNYIKNEEI